MDTNPELISHAADLLRSATCAVALTGAGISTPSGIPDFRSSGSGLWSTIDPMEVASISAFRFAPERFYQWIHPLAERMLAARPNPAHLALADLERAGHLDGIITQNIDSLHSLAGSTQVLEIHGHLRQATCVACYYRFPAEDILRKFADDGQVPRCTHCRGTLKPDAVLFGEELPAKIVLESRKWITRADVLLVAGSSLEVTPVALFPVEALNRGAQLIIVNHDPTYIDQRAALIIRQDVAAILPQLAAEVLGG